MLRKSKVYSYALSVPLYVPMKYIKKKTNYLLIKNEEGWFFFCLLFVLVGCFLFGVGFLLLLFLVLYLGLNPGFPT